MDKTAIIGIVAGLLIAVVYIMFFAPGLTLGRGHQLAAVPLHKMIVLVFGLLAFVCIGGGIVGIIYGATSETKLDFLFVHLGTQHVGVAFVGIGLIVAYFTVRSVLRSQHELAALPPDKKKPKKSHREKRARPETTPRR